MKISFAKITCLFIFSFILGFLLAFLSPNLYISDIDNLSEFAGISIALCALYFTYYQLKEAKRISRVNQEPHLMLSSSLHPSDFTFKLVINNYGNGPALIDSMKVFSNGSMFNKHPGKNLREIIRELDKTNVTAYVSGCDLNKTVVIGPNQQLELASIFYDHHQINDYNAFSSQVFDSIKNVNIIIEYKTTFDEPRTFKDGIV